MQFLNRLLARPILLRADPWNRPVEELLALVPSDRAGQFSSWDMLHSAVDALPRSTLRVLDLGCGDGRSIDRFRQCVPKFDWRGLDIENSPEVKLRTRQDCEFHTYDGVHIPFADGSFDLVFSNQVFEHVRFPERLLGEVCRVLTAGGFFAGSVSYLEPYHSYSLFNFTPYGWYTLVRASGLDPRKLAGGIDALSLIHRSISRKNARDSWWTLSPLNKAFAASRSLGVREKNYRILMNAGHIAFLCQKPMPD